VGIALTMSQSSQGGRPRAIPISVFLTLALLVLASSDLAMAQDRPQRSTPTPEATRSEQSEPTRQASRSQGSTPTPISIFLEEKITVGNNSAKSGESVRQNVIVRHTVDIKTSAQSDSSDFSDCLPQSGGRSSLGSIGLLTAPLALYIWRRMRKI
jgi:hypothetical protein